MMRYSNHIFATFIEFGNHHGIVYTTNETHFVFLLQFCFEIFIEIIDEIYQSILDRV